MPTKLLMILFSLFSSPLFSADTIPIKKDAEGQFVDPSVSQTKPLLGKAKTPATSKKAAADDEENEAPPTVNGGKPYVAEVSVFGSTRLNEVSLKQALGKDLDAWLKMGIKGNDKSVQEEEKLAKKIKEKYGFHSADWSIIQFFEPGNQAIHITLDVVEKEDVAKRLPFYPPPTGQFKDPGGLIRSWVEYENLSLDLVENGQLEPESEQCQGIAFHCPFGHKHDKLKKYEKIFKEGVATHFDKLVEIQSKEARPDFRAAATFLLAYHREGQKIVPLMVDRIRDPQDLVRNNALRVLGDIAEFNPQLVIPVAPIVQALNFPRASDRSKSVFVAHLMVLNSQAARDEVGKTALPALMQLLACRMPDQQEFAHAILRKVSGKDYPITDLAAWNNWYKTRAKELGVTGASK